jgi:hypothetical protein
MKLRQENLFALIAFRILTISLGAIFFLQSTPLSAQKNQKSAAAPGPVDHSGLPKPHPFEPAEELVYVAEFSRALLKKVDVADFRFTASRQPTLQKASYSELNQRRIEDPYLLKFTGDVASKGFFSKLFNLRFREQIESIVEPRSFSVQTTRKVDEQGKRARVSEANYRDGKVKWIETDPNDHSRPPRSAEATFAGQVQDVLSAIYYLRTQPLEVGKNFEVTVSDSGVVYQVPVKVVEKKLKKSVLGRAEAIRVDPEVFGPKRMLSGEGQFSIWFTNDARRVPISARIKTKYGTFDITLRKLIQHATPASVASANHVN